MQIPNLTLAYLVAELAPLLEGSIVRKVQELPNGWLKLKLQTRQGTKDLIITPNIFFITSYSLSARQTTSGFGAFLRKRLANKKILSLKQHGLDRIVLFEFDNCFLVLELFAKGNVILVSREMEIVSAYRKEHWKDRTISKGMPYKFPSSKGLNPMEVSLPELKKAFSESKVDCIRSLVSALNIAPIAGEEACLKAGVEKSKPAMGLNESGLKKLLAELKGLYSVGLEKLKPGISGEQLLPFELRAATAFEKRFSSLNEALDENFSKQPDQKKQTGNQASARQLQLEKSLERQLASKQELEKRDADARASGEAIYSHYPAVSEALQLAKQFADGKKTKEEVMYKLKPLGLELKQIDLKNRKIIVELEL